MLNKKALSERDICTKFITPALVTAGWDIQKQVREEWAFTDGRVIVRGHKPTRGQRKRADYVLFYKSTMVAIIEAKENNHSVGHGMQQAQEYADIYQNHVFRVRALLKEAINEYFMMLFINSPFTKAYYENCAKRTTNLASINKTQMRNTPISFPTSCRTRSHCCQSRPTDAAMR